MMRMDLDDINEPEQAKIGIKFLLSIPIVKFGCVSVLLANAVGAFLDPIFASKMLDMGIYADKAGYVYVFLQASYSIFSFSGGVLMEYISKYNLIVIGYFTGFIGFAAIGHHVFFDSNYLSLIIIGLFLNGFSYVGGNVFATMLTKDELMKA
mmetsp:Transcript_10384/g.9179  ORF Transcript_10384/g.9179 Transcript_10384/m.9179 type:complete len:152 (+) Transcript_10384:319-774(+)